MDGRACECQQASMFVTLLAKHFFRVPKAKQSKASQAHTQSQLRSKLIESKQPQQQQQRQQKPATNRMIYNASRISKDCCFILFLYYTHFFLLLLLCVHMWSCGAYFFFRSTTFSTSDFNIYQPTIYVLWGWWIFFPLPFAFCSLPFVYFINIV